MSLTVDLSGVEERDFEPLPNGKYHVSITDYDIRETGEEAKHPENDYLNVEFTVQSGDHEGRKLWTNVMLPPYEPFMLYNILRASGKTEEELKSGEFELDFDDLHGLEMVAKVGRQKGNKDYNEIKRFEPYDPDTFDAGGSGDSLLP